jgi:hypothetical protein
MTDPHHPSLDELLDRLAGCSPRPNDVARAAMRARIRLAIQADAVRATPPARRASRIVVAASIVAAAACVIAIAGPGGRVAQAVEPVELPPTVPVAIGDATVVLDRGAGARVVSAIRTVELATGSVRIAAGRELVAVRPRGARFTVTAMYATFAVTSHGSASRLDVYTGVVWVRDDDGGTRAVTAPASWTTGMLAVRDPVTGAVEAALAPSPAASLDSSEVGRARATAPLEPPPAPAPPLAATSQPAATARGAAPTPPLPATDHRAPHTASLAGPPVAPSAPPVTGHAAPAPGPSPAAGASPERPVGAAGSSPEARDRYAAAEAALARGDLEAAREALAQVLAAAPIGARADLARLDLARIAWRRHDAAEARAYAERVATTADSAALREAGHHLWCRIDAATDPAGGRACARAYRAAYPTSPRQAEMLALEASSITDPCEARPLLTEYLARFPGGAYAATATVRVAACRR